MTIIELIQKAIKFDRGDARRIQHFIKVHEFALLIGTLEGLSADRLKILEAAAVLHDIGIHAAEDKYGCTSGKRQEAEGPAIAQGILATFDCPEPFIDRVCFLIAHHHTYDKVDGSDYQILLEADFLVNAYEDHITPQTMRTFRDRVFRTTTGISLLETMFGL